MKIIVVLAETIILLLIIALGFYDWFYTQGVRRITKQWGVIFPPEVEKLITLNFRVSAIAILILLLLIIYSFLKYD